MPLQAAFRCQKKLVQIVDLDKNSVSCIWEVSSTKENGTKTKARIPLNILFAVPSLVVAGDVPVYSLHLIVMVQTEDPQN